MVKLNESSSLRHTSLRNALAVRIATSFFLLVSTEVRCSCEQAECGGVASHRQSSIGRDVIQTAALVSRLKRVDAMLRKRREVARGRAHTDNGQVPARLHRAEPRLAGEPQSV